MKIIYCVLPHHECECEKNGQISSMKVLLKSHVKKKINLE